MLKLEQIENQPLTHCNSCEAPLSGAFCSNCGQKILTKRFTIKRILKETIANVFNLEKGFFFTLKRLFVAPEEVISSYIQGQTKKYYHPIRLLFIVITLSVLITLNFDIWSAQTEQVIDLYKRIGMIKTEADLNRMVKTMKIMEKFLTVVPLLLAPFLSFASFLLYKSKKLYFAEHCILNMYVMAAGTILGFIPLTIFILFPSTVSYSFISGMGIYWILYTIVYKRLFQSNTVEAMLYSFLTILIGYLSMIISIMVLTVIIIIIITLVLIAYKAICGFSI